MKGKKIDKNRRRKRSKRESDMLLRDDSFDPKLQRIPSLLSMQKNCQPQIELTNDHMAFI